MGIENMRRWPVYIVFALCILLLLSLFSSWNSETELRNTISEISTQLQECSKQQTTCMEESLTLLEQRDGHVLKENELEKQKTKLVDEITEYKNKLTKSEGQLNHTKVDVELCRAELQSLKNLQVSKTAIVETLRLEKDTLTTQLAERKQKIEELEKEILRLKTALTTKSGPNPSVPSKVTPAVQPPKISAALSAKNPINKPVIENDAKEDLEDPNVFNDGNDQFDPQVQ